MIRTTPNTQPDIVVFSHLRWEFVWQRPQHLMQRLSKQHRIIFVEEPRSDITRSRIFSPHKSIVVLQPAGAEHSTKALATIVQEQLQILHVTQPIVWFYSAAFVGLLQVLPHQLVVYDCMDELSAFQGASHTLQHQEQELLSRADLVFTGGKSLYEAKRRYHSNVHCFPSSVDAAHFAEARAMFTIVPHDLAALSHPRVGFYGVLDERLDRELLSNVARQLPRVQFVMIGPVVKIHPDSLPQTPNIHYFGSKPYSVLPNYLKGFDITWMPFAQNRATRFISPTKTLEFMAAHKPIISTPIVDVVRDYDDVVEIAVDAKAAVQAIRRILRRTAKTQQRYLNKLDMILAATSWDTTATAMELLIQKQLQRLAAQPRRATHLLPAVIFRSIRSVR